MYTSFLLYLGIWRHHLIDSMNLISYLYIIMILLVMECRSTRIRFTYLFKLTNDLPYRNQIEHEFVLILLLYKMFGYILFIFSTSLQRYVCYTIEHSINTFGDNASISYCVSKLVHKVYGCRMYVKSTQIFKT